MSSRPDRPAVSSLDEMMPRWHYRERHRRRLSTSPEITMAAVRSLTWADVPLFRLIMRGTGLGRARFAADGHVLDLLLDNGFVRLSERPTEFVIGGVERLSARPVMADLGTITCESFRDLDEPGLVKICMNFSWRPGQLATETRVYATDRCSRIAFGVYWTLIRAGSGLIRHSWLKGIERRAADLTSPSVEVTSTPVSAEGPHEWGPPWPGSGHPPHGGPLDAVPRHDRSTQMIKWAGWLIVFYASAHTVGALTVEGAARYAGRWFSGALWGEDLATMSPAMGAYWLSVNSFGPPLLLIGLTVLWLERRGITPPRFIAWALGAWVVVGVVVAGPGLGQDLILLLAAGLLLAGAHRAQHREPTARGQASGRQPPRGKAVPTSPG